MRVGWWILPVMVALPTIAYFWPSQETILAQTSSSRPAKVSVRMDTNPMYQIVGIQADVDNLQINKVVINRGNCKIGWGLINSITLLPDPDKFPKMIKFGDTLQLVVACDVREVTVSTDKSEWTARFE